MAEARLGHADKVRTYLDKGCDIETRNMVIYANTFNYLMMEGFCELLLQSIDFFRQNDLTSLLNYDVKLRTDQFE